MRRRFLCNSAMSTPYDYGKYMTVEALEDGVTVTMPRDVEYGIDGKGWETLKAGKPSQSLVRGQMISFKCNLQDGAFGNIKISGLCYLRGNVLSLLHNEELHTYAFSKCFIINYSIVGIEKSFLPATDLAPYCYHSMFEGCTSLVNAPELPATTLAVGCYNSMFYGCTSLTTAPELPATNLADDCYRYMFHNCTNLNHIKMLATDISATDCLHWWVGGVASMGTFIKHKDAVLPTGDSGIPEGWTVVNDGEESGGGLEFPITLSQLTGTIAEYPEVAEYLLNSYNVPVGYTATDDMVNIVDDIYVETFGGDVDGKVIAISKSDDGNSLFLWTEKAINDIEVARLVAPSYYLGTVVWD